jgi:hypothetical protein
MQQSRANHYVPQFYLTGFAELPASQPPKKPVLWVYERGRPHRLSTPKHEAYEKDLYTFEDVSGEMSSIEGIIARIESRAAPVFRHLEDPDYIFPDSERYDMAVFMSLLFVRGPTGLEFISRSLGMFMKDRAQQLARDDARFRADYETWRKHSGGPSAEEVRQYVLEGNYEILQKSAGLNLRGMVEAWDHLSPILFKMQWQILHSEGGQFFFTNDNPIFTLLPSDRGTAKFGVGFCTPMVEVYLPVNRTVCLRLSETATESSAAISNLQVRQINRAIAICARRFLYAPERSTKIARLFDKVGGQLSYGVNAFIHPGAVESG